MFQILILLVALDAPRAAKFDPPDLEREARMHHAFSRGDEPTPLETTTLAPDAYVENYRINRGETLWSLSRTLYGDGNYWPRVWAQNHAITNPHLVREGHSLQVLLGSEDDAPAFRFTETGGDVPVQLTAAPVANPTIEIPPPELAPRPVLKIPTSFPEWQSVHRRASKSVLDDRSLLRRRVPPIYQIYLRGWVEDVKPVPVGTMLENDSEAGLPVVNQYIFVKLNRGEGQTNKTMLVVQPVASLRRVNEIYDADRDAYMLQTVAEIQLTEAVENNWTSSSAREKYETWRALITKTTGLTSKDTQLINGSLRFVDVSPQGPAGQASAQIMGSDHNSASVLYGAGDFIFLDRGSTDGVNVGELYDIFSDRRARHQGTPVTYSPAPSGRVKIVKVTEHLSTAFVLAAHGSIMQGDRVRQIARRQDIAERADIVDMKATKTVNKEIRADGFDEDADLEKEINESL